MKVFIGCSSYDDLNEVYYKEAKNFAKYLVDKDCTLVFGGSFRGIMGTVYDTFKENNGEIFAIQTEHYKEDLDHLDCNKEVVKTTLNQLERFMDLSDLLVFLPGGYGTYNELFYMICEYVNQTHNKKIVVYNINHYFDGLKNIFRTIKEEKFASLFDFVKIIDNLDEFKSYMEEIC